MSWRTWLHEECCLQPVTMLWLYQEEWLLIGKWVSHKLNDSEGQDVCNYVESLLWSEMFNDQVSFDVFTSTRDVRANVSVRAKCEPSGFKQTVVWSDAYGPVGQSWSTQGQCVIEIVVIWSGVCGPVGQSWSTQGQCMITIAVVRSDAYGPVGQSWSTNGRRVIRIAVVR